MDVSAHIEKRISECRAECTNYTRWLSKLRLPNTILVRGGSLLAFVGGGAVVSELEPKWVPGIFALLGGAMTGLHTWFGCEDHQDQCRKTLGQFESLTSRFEYLRAEQDETRRDGRLEELENELADVKKLRTARPWQSFVDFGPVENHG